MAPHNSDSAPQASPEFAMASGPGMPRPGLPRRAREIGMCLSMVLIACASNEPADGEPSGSTTSSRGDSGDEAGASSDTSVGPSDAGSSGSPEAPFTGCAGDSAAHEVFNAFWTEFDERYALFDIRLPGATWAAVGAERCDDLDAEMTDDALFDVLLGMAVELDDGHVQLEADDLDREGDGWASAYPFYDELYALELDIENNYLDGSLAWAADDWFAWGSIGTVGYISITSFDELSATGDESDDREAATAAMALAVAQLGDASGLIIDVRANEGGWDSVALDVARWVDGDATLAWSEARRNGPEHDDFSAWEDTMVGSAVADAFGGPVVVLTSGGTFSAAETFVLAMRVRDNVTIVGEPTSGHFSDLFDAQLPNGWSFTLSGERYRAADGTIYEAVGAPVDVSVALDVDALAQGQDLQLEAALAQLTR